VQIRLLEQLSRTRGAGTFLGALVIVLLALFLPGWYGAILLALIIAALIVLMQHTWAVAPPRARTMRVLALVALAAVAWFKAVH